MFPEDIVLRVNISYPMDFVNLVKHFVSGVYLLILVHCVLHLKFSQTLNVWTSVILVSLNKFKE